MCLLQCRIWVTIERDGQSVEGYHNYCALRREVNAFYENLDVSLTNQNMRSNNGMRGAISLAMGQVLMRF